METKFQKLRLIRTRMKKGNASSFQNDVSCLFAGMASRALNPNHLNFLRRGSNSIIR
jgi:hypothetical protein